MQRTRRDESTRVLCAGCTDAEAAPRRLARSRHTRHIGVTRNCSPTLVSKCQDCCPTGHHRFGFLIRRHRLDKYRPVSPQVLAPDGRPTQPLYQTLFQLVETFHFPAEQSANIVTGHQRAANLIPILHDRCSLKVLRRVALDQNGNSKTLHTGQLPTHPPTVCKIVQFTPLRSVHHKNCTAMGSQRCSKRVVTKETSPIDMSTLILSKRGTTSRTRSLCLRTHTTFTPSASSVNRTVHQKRRESRSAVRRRNCNRS